MTGPIVVKDILAGGWRDLTFEPFRDGVEICLLGEGDGPQWALLRYSAGASVPRHRHTGLETIIVLDGSQSDAHGTYSAGTMVLNPEGTCHAVRSETGCVVLIQWERPVEFVE